jgi:murein DD-endopeptidase MepM/ murein hydrolase activator NlpD
MSARPPLGALLALTLLVGCRDTTGASGEDLVFTAPITGTPMVDVFYGAYIDHDPGAGAHDYECGSKAYDGHLGIDVLLRNFRVQDAGVPVIAAADGVVDLVVDGRFDRNTSWDLGGGFGNHVVLSHAGGVTSTYGHLRSGSVAVSRGQRVERGALLGFVGSSGRSNWPHLHFEVRSGGRAVEPFAGACGAPTSLWSSQLAYQDGFLVTDAGITDQPVTLPLLLERPPTVHAAPLSTPALRFWLQVANQRAAVVRYELRAPGGALFDAIQRQVGSTFSMRYLLLTVPVEGSLTEPGEWEIRTLQEGELIWIQPFTLAAAPAADHRRAAEARPRPDTRALELQVLDQAPGSAGARP